MATAGLRARRRPVYGVPAGAGLPVSSSRGVRALTHFRPLGSGGACCLLSRRRPLVGLDVDDGCRPPVSFEGRAPYRRHLRGGVRDGSSAVQTTGHGVRDDPRREQPCWSAGVDRDRRRRAPSSTMVSTGPAWALLMRPVRKGRTPAGALGDPFTVVMTGRMAAEKDFRTVIPAARSFDREPCLAFRPGG